MSDDHVRTAANFSTKKGSNTFRIGEKSNPNRQVGLRCVIFADPTAPASVVLTEMHTENAVVLTVKPSMERTEMTKSIEEKYNEIVNLMKENWIGHLTFKELVLKIDKIVRDDVSQLLILPEPASEKDGNTE